MSSLRLVTFDLDDTLWDVAPVMNNAEALLREWLASNAARLGPVPIEHLWAIRTRLLDREPMLRHRLSELRRRILFHALLDAGYPQARVSPPFRASPCACWYRASASASTGISTASGWPTKPAAPGWW